MSDVICVPPRLRSPHALDLYVAATGDFDPLTVSAWSLVVTHPEGASVDWPLAVVSVSSSEAHLRHTFSASGAYDVPHEGRYELDLTATTPGGTRAAHPMILEGKDS